MTSTITTLTSHLNTLLEQQASIIRNAQAFAESLELSANMKELKKIASEWNVTPSNKTKKASYISALHQEHAEKNGLAEVNEHIEKLQYKIACAYAQERANIQQQIVRVFFVDEIWWTGTDEEFKAYYPLRGMVIHFTAHPEVPTVLTQEVEIDGRTYTVCGRTQEEVTQEVARIEQEVNAMWEEVTRIEQEVTEAWLEHCKKLDEQQALQSEPLPLTSNPSILTQDVKINGTAYTVYGCDKEELAQETLALTEAVHREEPLQGVASFLSSLAVFASHDILPLNIVGDVTLYEQLKSKWDAMDGDEKCQCDWCDAEPLQYQEQEELQHAEHLQEQLPTVEIRKDGTVGISTEHARITIPAREAYALLSELYDKRDKIYKAAQQNESEPAQKSELQQYAEKHLSEHIKEAGIILYTVVTDRYALPVRYLLPDAITPEWFSPCKFSDPGEASQEFRAKYPDAEYVSAEELEEEYQKRDALYRDPLLTENKKAILLGTGLLSWPRKEHITGRYGLVALFDEDWDQSPWQVDITSLVGKHGTLVAVLDGEEIELGKGKCFTEQYYDNDYIGLRPSSDYLEEEWLSPSQLRKVDGRVIHKPVELWFVEQ